MKKIDVHSHVMPEPIFGAAGSYGPELLFDGEGGVSLRTGDQRRAIRTVKSLGALAAGASVAEASQQSIRELCDPETRLVEMRSKGIDQMGVTAAPPLYFYWIDEALGVPFAHKYNDALHEYCSLDPGRLFMIATLPLQNIDESIREIDRSVSELGAKGISIGASRLAGLELYDEALFPVYDRISALGIPLMVHPYAGGSAAPQSDRYSSGVADLLYQETMAFVNLTYGGVLDEFPNLRVYLTHGGGFVPFQFGRLATFALVRDNLLARRPLEEYLDAFYFDNLVHDVRARAFLVEWMGAGRILVGDNFGGLDSVDGFAFVDELSLSDSDRELIYWKNAAALFDL